MFNHEIFVVGAQHDNAFNKTNKSRDTCPTENQVEDTLACMTEIELMNAEATEKNCKNCSNNFVLYRPIGSFGICGGLLDIYNLLGLCLLRLGSSQTGTTVLALGGTIMCGGSALRTHNTHM